MLILRGSRSDLLSREVAEEMKSRNASFDKIVVEINGCGHVPSLCDDHQLEVVGSFLGM